MPRRYLLSVDSGGIRGIIPAIALRKLEKIDWEAILAGGESEFRIGSQNTLWEQYKAQAV